MLIDHVWTKLALHPEVYERTSSGQAVLREMVQKTLSLLASKLVYPTGVGGIFDANIAFMDICIGYNFVAQMLEAEGNLFSRYLWGVEYRDRPSLQRDELLRRLADLPGYLASLNMDPATYLRQVLGLREDLLQRMLNGQGVLRLEDLLREQPEVVFMLKG